MNPSAVSEVVVDPHSETVFNTSPTEDAYRIGPRDGQALRSPTYRKLERLVAERRDVRGMGEKAGRSRSGRRTGAALVGAVWRGCRYG